MVPTLTCGLSRSNFSFATCGLLLYGSGAARRGANPGNLAQLGGDRSPLAGLDDLLGDVRGDLVVALELHRVRGPALRDRSQVGRVAEHLRHRAERADHHGVAPGLLPLDLAAAAHEVTDHVAHEVLR